LIPVERGFTRSLSKSYFGGDGEKPVVELKNAVSKHEGLLEASLAFEGLVKGKSQHASGVYVYDAESPYFTYNAAMKTSSGLLVSQFDMQDSDYMSGLKLDLLTVEGIDKIRTCMDLLIEHGYMEQEKTLRETYNKYLHPDVLVYDDKEMWKKVADNKVPDLFQFDTNVGLQCAKKSKPTNITELATANNLMRLMSDSGEQPIDKYVRFKNNPKDWIQEMKDYGLTEEEMEVVKKHLGKSYGVSSSQEEMMELLMDEKIGGFTIPEANMARKVVGKKLMDKIPEVKGLLFSKGVK
jgi:DNA polymerase-3 subunit alpha